LYKEEETDTLHLSTTTRYIHRRSDKIKMQFTTSALAAVLAFTASVAATPLSARADALKDWQVTSVGTGTPSGRPGSYPWSTLHANITDPNLIDLGPAKDDGTPVTVPAGSQGLVRLSIPKLSSSHHFTR
jgi:hypothetical protein